MTMPQVLTLPPPPVVDLAPLAPFLRPAFLVCGALFLLLVLRYHSFGLRGARNDAWWAGRLFRVAIVAAFAGVLVYQSTWQLFGFTRPKFAAFVRHHNRRPLAPERVMTRGRILDRNGYTLAADDPYTSGARTYTIGPAGAHIVGYDHPKYGRRGIEKCFDKHLAGNSLRSLQDLDHIGRTLMSHRPLEGGSLRLTIDARLQQLAFALLDGRPGAVVAIQPRSGDILALVSSPAFDPANPTPIPQDQNKAPRFNRALDGLYPPGSIFKTVTAANAIEAGRLPRLTCPPVGFLPAGTRTPIRDHEYYEYKRRGKTWPGRVDVDLETAYVHSSNVYFAHLGVLLGEKPFNAIRERYCFEEAFPLAQGKAGSIASAACQIPVIGVDQQGELAQCAIGQGRLLVTPFHMALLASAIAADGTLYQPRLVYGRKPTVHARVLHPETAGRMTRLMVMTVKRGTARKARIWRLGVAGKTGTAETPNGQDHAWFIAFAPVKNPQIALVVLVEHGGYAASSAVPLAAELLRCARKWNIIGENAP
ncbi:MAG: penicillin-binding protein 2 [Lentisphaeria bacterium]|nr:penicillin-binding protein 2 [Lentisphaeria bacterium]